MNETRGAVPIMRSVEAEVIGNILAQPLGPGTVADLNLPREFLQRCADRVIRASFYERSRIVVDGSVGAADTDGVPLSPGDAGGEVALVTHELSNALRSASPNLIEGRPGFRGFRCPLDVPEGLNSTLGPGIKIDAWFQQGTAIVAKNLARRGLIRTTADLVRSLGVSDSAPGEHSIIERLATCGLPVDLLALFQSTDHAADNAAMKVDVGRRVRAATTVDTIATLVSRDLPSEKIDTCFSFVPVRGNVDFVASPESGQAVPSLLRLQLTRATHYSGEGDGGCVDVAIQALRCVRAPEAIVSVEAKHFHAAAEMLRGRGVSISLIAEPLPVTQWAADNGKAGCLRSDGSGTPATLVPRYASRGEEASIFIPGESTLAEGLARVSHTVIQSCLLFQGGNILICNEPSGRRVMLLGEAEVFRNQSLGLTRHQVLACFKAEFGVDHCVVLPAASNHIDYEVCVRATTDGRMLAFVNDTVAGMTLILKAGVGALHGSGLIATADSAKLIAMIESKNWRVVLGAIGGMLGPQMVGPGNFGPTLAASFSVDQTDSGVGNLQRFLLALDWIASQVLTEREVADDRHLASVLRSFIRCEADRRRIRESLEHLGWTVVLIPSTSCAERSCSTLNGFHLAGKYLMPTHGGLFNNVDEAARVAFQASLGPEIQLLPITTAESQRRDGGIHCSCAVYSTTIQ